jgi:hypothetical protein
MNNKLKYKKHIGTSVLMVSIFMLSIFMTSCEFELPEANSIPDATPPQAAFADAVGADYLTIDFGNLSVSATDFVWDFGDGTTSTEFEPTHTYAPQATDEVGTPYTVTLTASDKLDATSVMSREIVIFKPAKPIIPVPVIGNPGFDDPGDDGKNTSPWVDSNLGKTIQISSSSSFTGGKSSKYPNANSDPRVAYQEIPVTKNATYKLSYVYSIETGDASSVTVRIIGGSISDPADVVSSTIKSFEGTEQTGKTPMIPASITFNAGDNDIIGIYISNAGTATAYVDTFSIEVIED